MGEVGGGNGPVGGQPTTAACSGTFAEWSTVWDAIGYTDSGFTSDGIFDSSTSLMMLRPKNSDDLGGLLKRAST